LLASTPVSTRFRVALFFVVVVANSELSLSLYSPDGRGQEREGAMLPVGEFGNLGKVLRRPGGEEEE
jgi:hypothetical protein